MIGYKRGRFTGAIDSSGWCKDNPERFEKLKDISKYNELAFAKANNDIYARQKIFAESFVEPQHRMGIFYNLLCKSLSCLVNQVKCLFMWIVVIQRWV